MPHRAKPEHYKPLKHVVTLAAAARMTFRDPKTLRYAIDTGNLAAHKCGHIWLVSVPSLLENFPPSTNTRSIG